MEAVVPIWIAGSFATVLIQIVAVVDRLRLAELRGRDERERLSGVIEGDELEKLQHQVQGSSPHRMLREFADAIEVLETLEKEWHAAECSRTPEERWSLLGHSGDRARRRLTDIARTDLLATDPDRTQ